MKRRLALLAVAAMLGSLSMLAPASPASANGTNDVCVGTGNANLGLGLGYPVITGAKNLTTFAFTFTAGVCATKGLQLGGTTFATGTVHGWCGHSTGQGITYNGNDFHFISVGGTLLIYGHLIGIVNATPDPTAGSCLSKTAARFLITGAVLLQNVVLTGLVIPCVLTCN